ncbi:hypothetical protein MMC24_004338 [Lignoscripta atroalba]|nr:hypothetical protein [Lignoscripta atroalba]
MAPHEDTKDTLKKPTTPTTTDSKTSLFFPPTTPQTTAPSPPPTPTNLQNNLSKASKLKRKHSLSSTTPLGDLPPCPSTDPTNLEITHLRNSEHLSFSEIAARLNTKRDTSSSLDQPFHTVTSVYARYIRAKHRLAADVTEETIRKHPRRGTTIGSTNNIDSSNANPNASNNTDTTTNKKPRRLSTATPHAQSGFNEEEEDLLLVEAHAEVKNEFWEFVAKRVREKGGVGRRKGQELGPRECARRWGAL